ncbi:MAG TPA: gliding motility-associated C-terminal domain-containing protein, partial [Saprospiraceae bacterium]|nr:gliding motility-associated C-terminal domain-containing protein [Saprospiraceae bacterium]
FTAGTGPFLLNWIHLDEVGEIRFDSLGQYNLIWDGPQVANLIFTSSNGLEIHDSLSFPYPDPLRIGIHALQDFNGYNVPCHGDSLGQAEVLIQQPGTPPIQVQWSNGKKDQKIINMPAGLYGVTVTDSHGCVATESVTITEPSAYTYEIDSQDISCSGLDNGSIVLFNIQGGVPPIVGALNHAPFTSDLIYSGLRAGNYTLTLKDNNGCEREETLDISEPEPWHISLGPDTTIAYGSSLELMPILTGTPQGMLHAAWSDGLCDDCLARTITPLTPTELTLKVLDDNGCSSEDDIRVFVRVDRKLFIPNIFSPNGDQINDVFMISAGPAVDEITKLNIFDRWGDLVFSLEHFKPNDPTTAWD